MEEFNKNINNFKCDHIFPLQLSVSETLFFMISRKKKFCLKFTTLPSVRYSEQTGKKNVYNLKYSSVLFFLALSYPKTERVQPFCVVRVLEQGLSLLFSA